MGCLKPVLLIWLASMAVGSTCWAAPPTAEDVIGTSCGVALDVFSQCASSVEHERLAAICCTPYSVLKTFNCFCNPDFSTQAQAMMTADVRQALLQCPGEGHISAPIQCDEHNQQVGVWLDGSDAQEYLSSADAKFNLMKEINNQLSVAQPYQLSAQKGASDFGGVDSGFTLDLTVDVELGGGERVVRKGVTIGASDLSSSIADLTAEVDFEVGPDVSGSEIRQILQGVTEWIATMVDDQADPFGDLASFEQSGEMSSITAHVAEVISQMAGSLNELGADEGMDIEITYEFDLAAPEFNGMALKGSAQDLAPLRDSMISAASDYAMIDSSESLPSDSGHISHRHMDHGHMGHHHMGHGHSCFIRQTYRWLCHHKDLIRMALVVELVLCALFACVHLMWSCCLKAQSLEEGSSDAELKAPLIESASAYAPADERIIISPCGPM
ncbi:TPA: hypothetical protein ACH3X1_005076 [Trebouxia sp. C0004]